MDIIKYNYHINAYKIWIYILPKYRYSYSLSHMNNREIISHLYPIMCRLK